MKKLALLAIVALLGCGNMVAQNQKGNGRQKQTVGICHTEDFQ